MGVGEIGQIMPPVGRARAAGAKFVSAVDIGQASPESYLFQSGYLTIREKRGRKLILDYPNMEVLSSVSKLFLYGKSVMSPSDPASADLEEALARGDAESLVRIYNSLLASVPYDIYEREERKYAAARAQQSEKTTPYAESFYHALLFTLLWASRARTTAEGHSYWGRSDVEIEKNRRRYVIELKTADGKKAAEKAAASAMAQIRAKGYADRYGGAAREEVILLALAVDRTARRVGGYQIQKRALPEAGTGISPG
jgi:hypothetical protein